MQEDTDPDPASNTAPNTVSNTIPDAPRPPKGSASVPPRFSRTHRISELRQTSKKLPEAAFFLMASSCITSSGMYCSSSIYKLFLRDKIGLTTNETISAVHIVLMLILFMQPFGALVVDSYSNKYVIIVVIDAIAALSRLIMMALTLPSIKEWAWDTLLVYWTITVIVSIAQGGAAPAFAGNQFNLPEEKRAFLKFFNISYILNNISLMVAYYLSPTLKTTTSCFGEQDCYMLSFGMSFVLLLIGLIVFVSGYRYYVIFKPVRHVMIDVFKCIWFGFKIWLAERKSDPRPHWLEHATPKYDADLVDDIKRVLCILKVFAVLPVYHSVYTQLKSHWLFQATRMDGRVWSHTIIPEIVQLLHPLLGIVAMPIVVQFLDPLTRRFGMDRTFRRMIFGGILVSLSFVAAGILESYIIKAQPPKPKENESYLRIINNLDCNVMISLPALSTSHVELYPVSVYTKRNIKLVKREQDIVLEYVGVCLETGSKIITLREKKLINVLLQREQDDVVVTQHEQAEDATETGFPFITLIGTTASYEDLELSDSKGVFIEIKTLYRGHEPVTVEVVPEQYILYLNKKETLRFVTYLGGSYYILASDGSAALFEIRQPNSVHMLWMVPQSVLFVIGEIYFTISLQEFTYTEAPMSLKALCSALRIFANGIGEALVVVVTLHGHMHHDVEFYFFAVILFTDMIVLLVIALNYIPYNSDIQLI